MSSITKLLATTTVTVLVIAAPAHAAQRTYAGTTDGAGHIALDVKIKHGVVTKLLRVRGDKIPSTCEVSGPIPEVSFNQPAGLRVPPSGRVKGSYTQPTYGNVSTLTGRFDGDTVTGKIRVNYHYPAEDPYPEEDCDTGKLAFTAELGAPDQVAPDAG